MSDTAASNAPATPQPGEWVDLCAVTDVPEKGGKFVQVAKTPLAVFRNPTEQDAQGLRVMHDICPHAGGSLSAGWVSKGNVYCPWHSWPFRINDGKCPDNENICVQTYPTRIADGKVQVQLVPA